ncbi:MAG: hypothetical protein IPK79_07030 [Vampirovibrionales bacterium]|nr:hypothetical protein [Vampirovibrionales bacterium]
MASNGYTPMQQLMSNPAYFGLTQSNWQTRQNASAQLAAFDQKYGDLFQMGYSMSPMAAAMNQSAMRGIMAEQQTGQMVNMGGGGMAMLNSAIGYMNGDSSQLGNILNTPWNFSGGGMGAYPPQQQFGGGGYGYQAGGYPPPQGGGMPANGGVDIMQMFQMLLVMVQQMAAKKSS